MNEAIEFLIKKRNPQSKEEFEHALKEVLQEIILLGLSRSGFFEKAAFYGGTALRIMHGLDRFSEDLDFTLLKADKTFKLEYYFSLLARELKAYGFDVALNLIEKTSKSPIESAFLKANTKMLFLNISDAKSHANQIQNNQLIKIKFEVDVEPAVKFQTEIKKILLPSPFAIKVLNLPSLFSGKMHAILYRQWGNRVKGRDFYDLQWFLARNIPLNREYLEEKILNMGSSNIDILKLPLTKEVLISLFLEKISKINWQQAKQDVLPFLKDKHQVDFWSAEFFEEVVLGVGVE